MSDQVADILAEAREYIEEHGWYQGEFEDPEDDGTAVCAVGGLYRSQDLEPTVTDIRRHPGIGAAAQALARVIGRVVHDPAECNREHEYQNAAVGFCGCTPAWVVNWNDGSETTLQDVLDTFAKAEKIERLGYDPDLGYS